MKKYAVIGSPISHSLSPQIHALFAEEAGIDISYEAIEVTKENFKTKVDDLFNEGFMGLNVTLPLKEDAFNYAGVKSERASLSESVNTLSFIDSSIHGETTDGAGLLVDLADKGIRLEASSLLLLGAGGSARSIVPSLLSKNPKHLFIANRTIEKAESLVDKYKISHPQITLLDEDLYSTTKPDVVINSTSVGTLNDSIVLPEDLFRSKPKVYDLSYSKDETAFNRAPKEGGSKEEYDGLVMANNAFEQLGVTGRAQMAAEYNKSGGKDKYGNPIFFTDENVFSLKEGEKMVCKKIMNICVGDYDIFGEKFNFENMGVTKLEKSLETQLKIM